MNNNKFHIQQHNEKIIIVNIEYLLLNNLVYSLVITNGLYLKYFCSENNMTNVN